MFFESPVPLHLDVDTLLAPYLYLDKSKFKGDEDGDACFKKFSNEGNGVALKDRSMMDCTATAVLEGKLKPENWLAYVDIFTLYANHMDQQRFGDKPPVKEKEALVLKFLEAAFHLSPKYDYDHLDRYSPRELSSHAQLLHYLGKARRYAGVTPEERLPLLTNALAIAKHLSAMGCSEADDPHAYKNRISTYELPVNYCLQDLNRFDEAAALIAPQLSLAHPFHLTHAHVQMATILVKKYKHEGKGIDEALVHAQAAVEVSTGVDSTLIQYNARVCLMDTLQIAGRSEEATALAVAILAGMEDPLCGAKPLHREAAEKVIAASHSSSLAP